MTSDARRFQDFVTIKCAIRHDPGVTPIHPRGVVTIPRGLTIVLLQIYFSFMSDQCRPAATAQMALMVTAVSSA